MTRVQRVQDLQIGSGGLEGNHVRVHIVDRRNDIREFAVAHMGMDLRFRFYAAVHQTERGNGKVQIVFVPVGFPQGELFAEGRLVDLDDAYPVCLQIQDLVPDGQGNLRDRLPDADILPRERPVQNGDRSGKHSLYGPVCLGLGIYRPFDGDRLLPADVSPDDRRFYAAGAVGLHPGLLREKEAGQGFPEIFDHVVAFVFAVHQHIQTDALLPLYGAFDFFAVEFSVLLLADLSLSERGAVLLHILRLREGADGGRRENRKLQRLLLDLFAFFAFRGSGIVGVADPGQAFFHLGISAVPSLRKQLFVDL